MRLCLAVDLHLPGKSLNRFCDLEVAGGAPKARVGRFTTKCRPPDPE